jgi:hypothetical protein
MHRELEVPPPIRERPSAAQAPYGAGVLVWYRQTIRGGYGFDRYVPAVFVGYTRRRCRIALERERGDAPIRIAVDPARIFHRLAEDVEEFA